ncbi:MAG: sulfite exporter TauE/SafE family protein [Acidobacteriota bacterium]
MLGTLAFLISTVAAGGGALVLIPLASLVLPVEMIPPVLGIASLVSSTQRVALYRKDVERPILVRVVPGLVFGIVVGSLLLVRLEANGLRLCLGVFLLASALLPYLLPRMSWPRLSLAWFVPAAAVTAFLSTVMGAAGPLMNPVYLGHGLARERMIGTKAASTWLMQAMKLVSYAVAGLLASGLVWSAGLALAAGALVGNVVGKKVLSGMSDERFRHCVRALLLVSGALMIRRALAG